MIAPLAPLPALARTEPTTAILDWRGLYKNGWKGEIVPDAFQHPAKFSRRLIAKIYDHLLAEGLLQRGDSVVDPFGGVALGALDAMRLGLHWTGCELEEKFVHLGRANIELWNARYSSMPNWGSAHLLHGDSRNLASIVRAADACVSSPPYIETRLAIGEGTVQQGNKRGEGELLRGYGDSSVNLGNLREGDFSAVVSSPPYEEARIGTETGPGHTSAANVGRNENYGTSDGQLGSMTGGDFAAAVSSPPYAEQITYQQPGAGGEGNELMRAGYSVQQIAEMRRNNDPRILQTRREAGYSRDAANLGNNDAETFWLAARQIVAQTYSILTPGGVSAWVCKDFVRNKQRVPFCAQWLQLCEAVGFRHLYTARAWLVEENGTQLAHDGNHKSLKTERKSFFRRLNEKNGGPRIDFEEVIFMRKP